MPVTLFSFVIAFIALQTLPHTINLCSLPLFLPLKLFTVIPCQLYVAAVKWILERQYDNFQQRVIFFAVPLQKAV